MKQPGAESPESLVTSLDRLAQAIAEKDAEIGRLSTTLNLKQVLIEEMGRVLEAQAAALDKLEARLERLEEASTSPPRERAS